LQSLLHSLKEDILLEVKDLAKVLLKKPARLRESTSYVSSGNFFHDLHGFPPDAHAPRCAPLLAVSNAALFSRTRKPAVLIQQRGFKSKRYNQEGGSPFRKGQEESSSHSGLFSGGWGRSGGRSKAESAAVMGDQRALQDFVDKMSGDRSTLGERVSEDLSKEERAKISAAIQGYIEGNRAKGKGDEGGAASSPSSSLTAISAKFWGTVGKLASFLVRSN